MYVIAVPLHPQTDDATNNGYRPYNLDTPHYVNRPFQGQHSVFAEYASYLPD